VDYLQVLDENGTVDMSQFPKDLTDAKLVEMLKYMLFARALDAKALSLQRQGRAVTYAPLVGEEATQVGTASERLEKLLSAELRAVIFVPNAFHFVEIAPEFGIFEDFEGQRLSLVHDESDATPNTWAKSPKFSPTTVTSFPAAPLMLPEPGTRPVP